MPSSRRRSAVRPQVGEEHGRSLATDSRWCCGLRMPRARSGDRCRPARPRRCSLLTVSWKKCWPDLGFQGILRHAPGGAMLKSASSLKGEAQWSCLASVPALAHRRNQEKPRIAFGYCKRLHPYFKFTFSNPGQVFSYCFHSCYQTGTNQARGGNISHGRKTPTITKVRVSPRCLPGPLIRPSIRLRAWR